MMSSFTLKEFLKEKVLKVLNNAGFEAYFVGGCVRDLLSNKTPHDYDICTSATPEEIHKVFQKFSNVSENSEPFGVTIVLIPTLVQSDDLASSCMEVEIATLRKDITKGRHPKVDFTKNITEDAMRRDFTVNALYEDIDGNIIDLTGLGKSDIEKGILRFVGNPVDRLKEDPLRIYRYVRFLSTKDLIPAYDVRDLVAWHKCLDFTDVSKERKLKELTKAFAGKNFMSTFPIFLLSGIAGDSGFLSILNDMKNVIQSWKWHCEGSIWENDKKLKYYVSIFDELNVEGLTPIEHGTVFDHTYSVMNKMESLLNEGLDERHRYLLMLSAFLHDIGKCHSKLGTKHSEFDYCGVHIVEDIPKVSDHDVVGAPLAYDFCKSLGLSNDDCEFIKYMVENHMEAHKLGDMKSLYKVWKFVRHPNFIYLCMLAKADSLGSMSIVEDEMLGIDESLEKEFFVPALNKTCKIKKLAMIKMPEPILNGDYLIEKGRKPGPLFKKMIEKAYQFQIDKGITDIEKLYQTVKNIELKKNEKD